MWVMRPSSTKMRWPQPTAQYGHTDGTTLSAVVTRAGLDDAAADRAASPRPERSSPLSCRMTGHDSMPTRASRRPNLAILGGVFRRGESIVVRQVWDGLLWAARPARVVDDADSTLVHWSPAGSLGCFATSRYFPGRDRLPRNERQLVSLETRRWHYRGVPARGTSLTFVREGSWSSISLTWLPDGRFVHWYVNFELPSQRWSLGYDTLDLVLDIVVAPDWSWEWKDRDQFVEARRRGIFDSSIADAVDEEAHRIEQEIISRSGPFAADWRGWRPPEEWTPPELPDQHSFCAGVGIPPGTTVTLDAEPISS